MHESVGLQNEAVKLHEPCGSEALAHLAHLWVGERNPYFAHFAGSEEAVDELDVGAEECHIRQPFGMSLLGTCPHSCALYVDANIVLLGEASCKPHGIFTLSAAKFHHNGVAVTKHLLAPTAAQLTLPVVNGSEGELVHVGQPIHLGKFLQFVLSHLLLITVLFLRKF